MHHRAALSRRAFLKTIGLVAAASPFAAPSLLAKPRRPTVLRHASFGASGMALSDINHIAQFPSVELIAVADVDLNRTGEVRKRYPSARIYQDWRELLDKEHKNLDSVNVSTPDHMHAPIALSAMQLGKHVYCQKPLTHDVAEVRQMMRAARERSLVTQMGIQIHSTSHYQLAVLLVQAGAIGKIKEVHSWCPKSWGDPAPLPEREDPVPAGFDWDLWLGVCADRPYIGNAYYHPNNWRNRLDFGTGTLGDMGCHIFDPVVQALKVKTPLTIRSEGPAPNQWNWAINSHIEFVFPGSRFTADKTVKVIWYDGEAKMPQDVLDLLEGDQRPNTGSIFVGTHGTMVLPHVNRPLLYPDKKFENFRFPEVPSLDHWGSFVQACLGGEPTTAGFEYAGPLTETVLLGCIATRFPQTTLHWNPASSQFSEQAANAYLRREYRPGWQPNSVS